MSGNQIPVVTLNAFSGLNSFSLEQSGLVWRRCPLSGLPRTVHLLCSGSRPETDV